MSVSVNGAFIGGAPPVARGSNAEPDFDVNETGMFNNATPGFRAMEKAFYGYHPMRVTIAGTPATGMRVVGESSTLLPPFSLRSLADPMTTPAGRTASAIAPVTAAASARRRLRTGMALTCSPRTDCPP